MDENKETLTERLKSARKLAMLSTEELAEKIGKSKQIVNFYETGKRNPSIKILAEIGRACNVKLDYFLRQKPKIEFGDIMVFENNKLVKIIKHGRE